MRREKKESIVKVRRRKEWKENERSAGGWGKRGGTRESICVWVTAVTAGVTAEVQCVCGVEECRKWSLVVMQTPSPPPHHWGTHAVCFANVNAVAGTHVPRARSWGMGGMGFVSSSFRVSSRPRYMRREGNICVHVRARRCTRCR